MRFYEFTSRTAFRLCVTCNKVLLCVPACGTETQRERERERACGTHVSIFCVSSTCVAEEGVARQQQLKQTIRLEIKLSDEFQSKRLMPSCQHTTSYTDRVTMGQCTQRCAVHRTLLSQAIAIILSTTHVCHTHIHTHTHTQPGN